MKRILITLPVTEHHKKRLEGTNTDCSFGYVPLSEVTIDMVQNSEIIVGNVPASFIAASDTLELLQLNSAGTDAYIVPGVLSSKTILTNATGAYGKTVAEHMFGMMMCLQKKLHLYRDDRVNGDWNDYGTVTSITGATVAVIGLGDIGLYFAGMAKALGAYVIGVKRRKSDCPKQADELHLMEDIDEIIPKSDVIVSFLPNTPSTYHLYDTEFFSKMKNSAVFLNGGRGSAVDQDALLSAVQNREISAAGLDVTDPEPLPPTHPLWREKNIMITPHVSGSYHLPETLDKIVEIAATNIENYLTGKSLKNLIDFETGYCK
ncbi:D-2-hydroxyacid dehydrogenase [Anaerocolumna sp. MB42-C2]|uniref:D-2-hydroxyacid dehydrogenase n=1 Tax=Anaerocolumna sp. MB42-C2 TaxID=3070997 RepID=UPI0027E1363E|nr:D-2-hydroxyacid dehydrogenase [Anaerocolumna sp. MB42-C2]WMJ87499.1 D-2-hydroxyacid dehydrogenase [Anaerocolumna sp. MB42-C2]